MLPTFWPTILMVLAWVTLIWLWLVCVTSPVFEEDDGNVNKTEPVDNSDIW